MLPGHKVSSKVITALVPGLGDKTITFRINGSGKLVIEASMDGLYTGFNKELYFSRK